MCWTAKDIYLGFFFFFQIWLWKVYRNSTIAFFLFLDTFHIWGILLFFVEALSIFKWFVVFPASNPPPPPQLSHNIFIMCFWASKRLEKKWWNLISCFSSNCDKFTLKMPFVCKFENKSLHLPLFQKSWGCLPSAQSILRVNISWISSQYLSQSPSFNMFPHNALLH